MKVVTIVQARMGSSRLPGKVLAPLAGEPMLRRVMIRLESATTVAVGRVGDRRHHLVCEAQIEPAQAVP